MNPPFSPPIPTTTTFTPPASLPSSKHHRLINPNPKLNPPFLKPTKSPSLPCCCIRNKHNNNNTNLNLNLNGNTTTTSSPPPPPPSSPSKLNYYVNDDYYLNDYHNNNNTTTNTGIPDLPVSRLEWLVNEFQSLTEPIDRVRRLLDYAAHLPPFDEAARSPENRVTGCTTQVWIQVEMDGEGRVRFKGDSDSEITKGFVSCLVWLLDGAAPQEVAAVKATDLSAMNVGLYGKEQSRVNTWHNVLVAMQKRTLAAAAAGDVNETKASFADKKQARWQELDANLSLL
ncbi:hypothetical protein Tsubulata_041525 [Turnera subulata]|uniref:Fe-S metabolism associated domain-containing protein n=1 Tax=Turnera subulata TaxID=218843 RepID=A0A9Q0FQ79_9ROSI|nr:hypothetical protein Tsubulata_041525 [Turnera subulata]